jgi:putative FmdB family regulatory protein
VPTYQYACTACDERLEAVQSFTDAPLTECPACGGALRKVFSAVGVVFKGSGFYKTDSRGKTADAKGEKGEKAPAAASASADSGSTSSTGNGSSAKGSGSGGSSAKPAAAAAGAAPASKSA